MILTTAAGKKLTGQIRFVVRSIILEPDTRSACIEMRGYATRTNGRSPDRDQTVRFSISDAETCTGQPYNNDYIWLTQWNDEGKIFTVRSYHDTSLAEKVLHED